MKNPTIIGAIAGDIIGSPYEFNNTKTINFELFHPDAHFTDDTVLTIAIANSLLTGKSFVDSIHEFGNMYPDPGYGGRFQEWLKLTNKQPYNSWGNGSAMRVSPVGFFYYKEDDVLRVAKETAEVTHNHPEGIKGAQAIALAIDLAKAGMDKLEIRREIVKAFNYNLSFTLDEIRDTYTFHVGCKNSVPQAIVAFHESTDYESAIRLAISIGGDSDTIACMTGGIAAAYYKEIPDDIIEFTRAKLPKQFLEIIDKFDKKIQLCKK